jgi:hypothetical protein
VAIGEEFRREHAEPPWYAGLLLRVSLWLTWFAPFWSSFRFRTFGGLDEAAREELLEQLLEAKSYNVRMAIMFLKITVCTLVLGDERALRKLNAYGLADAAELVPGRKSLSGGAS